MNEGVAMNQSLPTCDADVIEQAMKAYLMAAANARTKNRKMKQNMECRRKLEIKREQQRLQREIAEFEFN
jgi:hypothetical protein